MRMTATSRPARAPARWTLPGGGPQAAQAFRLLDTATARLVQSPGSSEYLLSISCQGGALQECWLSAGRHCTEDLPAEASAADVAAAVKNGGYGPDNARVYAAALQALTAPLTELVRDEGYHGTASLPLRA